MTDFDEYIRQSEPHKREKGYAWQTAIGLQTVDGLKPSDYLIETARQHIEGDITIDEVQERIKSYYQSKTIRVNDKTEEEADKASVNITKLLGERSLAFTVAGFTAVHRRIFEGVFKFAGKIRDYNITKKEWVLDGDTVLYVSAPDIRKAIEHDIEQEKAFDYTGLSMEQVVSHITKFVSGLWQIHPFGEGNTRTTAVFVIQYLRSIGFDVENDLFAKHSWYFRNALVRANYQNVQKGVKRNPEYLERFFRNLLMDEKNELRNRTMLTQTPDELSIRNKETGNRTSTGQATVQLTEQERILISTIGHEQFSMKQLMEQVGLKHRPTFLENYINPAMKSGLVRVLYPERPNHPRQKYLLTAKGASLYNAINQ
ncbi:MAG: Fic family protein [Mediterranea sp.]|jgi:fido (protein-threonine AMPylation protein)/predicted transcriptional regulator|nr:Fic family protein [Mediterranea sp.]